MERNQFKSIIKENGIQRVKLMKQKFTSVATMGSDKRFFVLFFEWYYRWLEVLALFNLLFK